MFSDKINHTQPFTYKTTMPQNLMVKQRILTFLIGKTTDIKQDKNKQHIHEKINNTFMNKTKINGKSK